MALTPLMNLTLPTVSVTLGPQWATEVNAAFDVVDAHDHTSGKGTPIPSSGLNINADLDFNENRLLNVKAAQHQDLASTLTGVDNINSTYVVGGDLYYTNNAGTAVQITTGGTLATSPGSITTYSTTAVASDLIINSADTFVYLITDTTAPRTITLPLASAVSAGRIYIIKDASGSSNSNNVTITAAGADTIDGNSTLVLDSNYGSFEIVGDGATSWLTT